MNYLNGGADMDQMPEWVVKCLRAYDGHASLGSIASGLGISTPNGAAALHAAIMQLLADGVVTEENFVLTLTSESLR